MFKETCITFLIHTKLYNILLQNNVVGYFRYVDDILIVYNDHSTDTDKLLELFNNALPTMTFSIEKESDDSINFLDITIKKDRRKLLIQCTPKTNHYRYHNTQWLQPPMWAKTRSNTLPT